MKYKNTKTGATIDTNAKVAGDNWEVISEKKEIKEEPKEKKSKNNV